MRVICKYDSSNDLPLSQWSRPTPAGFSTITVGKEYEVFGMTLRHDRGIDLLLADDGHRPDWFPVEFFSVVDSRLPVDWFFRPPVDVTSKYIHMWAFWGYERLVMDKNHPVNLIERESEDIQHFYEVERRYLQTETTDEDLLDYAKAVGSREEFAQFVEYLNQQKREGWGNKTLEQFLGGLSGFAKDMGGYYKNMGEAVDVESITWRIAAEMLLAAAVY